MSKRQAQMRGIVVAADSAEKVQELYRSVVTGSKVQVLESADGEFQITTASDSNLTMLNPVDGEQMSVVFDGHLPDSMNAVASSSEKTVEATYMVCTAGCGNHIIADDETLLQRCPACASDLPTLEDDNVKKQNNVETQKGETIIAFASTLGTASEKYASMVRGDAEIHNYDCSGIVVASASEMNFDPYQAVAAAKIEDYEPKILQAIAGSAQEVEAHHYVCVSSSCGMHVLASDESPLFCPHCSSGLIDPQDAVATASDDDDLDDDLDDEEDCEDDDCEDDEEDYEEEEEDDEDVLTLSVSSAKQTRKGGARKKQAAVASAGNAGEQKQVQKQVCVAASFVTYAAD